MENQIVEWKKSWRDEYLEWVCGFANAQGGVLEIGRNDKGEIVGLPDAVKLLELLPNKIRNTTGVLADIDIRDEDGNPEPIFEASNSEMMITFIDNRQQQRPNGDSTDFGVNFGVNATQREGAAKNGRWIVRYKNE